jgi:hypothetical protein
MRRVQNIPDSSPTHGGWVEYEAKRGKWSKRWLSLREHALWIGKREGGRGAELLCQLSTFDAYVLTRAHKAPRPAVFAVKSTESLAFFEDAADYLHMFAVDERSSELWTQKIWLARVRRSLISGFCVARADDSTRSPTSSSKSATSSATSPPQMPPLRPALPARRASSGRARRGVPHRRSRS